MNVLKINLKNYLNLHMLKYPFLVILKVALQTGIEEIRIAII